MKNITPQEAHDMIEKIPNTIFVDVRENGEVAELSIPKTIHIPLGELAGRLGELPSDATIIFHCRGGGRSAQAAQVAELAGCSNVCNVSGGIMSWEASGLPVIRGGGHNRGFSQQGTTILVVVALIVIVGVSMLLVPHTQSSSQGLSAAQQKSGTYADISSRELASMLEKKDFFLVNVHVPYEGELKDTDAFIPYDQVAENLNKLPKDKNAKIVLYCRSGRMSEIAGGTLAGLGYTNVSQLSGGMIDWERSGYDIIRK